MLGIYFSGTGNSRYALEVFLGKLDNTAKICPIENHDAASYIKDNEEIVISYPVQFSNIPKMLRDFVVQNRDLWQGKRIFVIATMGLFSGDGAGVLARLLKKYGARITGGLHLKMPDSIADEKALKRPLHHLALAGDQCTMCYRCVNTCPAQAITLLGKYVIEQGTIEKYLSH